MQNIIKWVWNAVITVLIGLIVILAALLWGSRLLGYEIFMIQSGSMEPNYHVGSLVYVKPVDPAELEAGDVITFELGGGVRGTHRIIEVLDDNGNLSFQTKGDNNEHADTNPVLAKDIVGEVEFTIPYLGFVITYIQQPSKAYIIIIFIAVMLLLTILPNLIFPEENKKEKKQDAE